MKRLGAVLFGAVVASGCRADVPRVSSATTVDSSGVHIVSLASHALELVPEWRLGVVAVTVIGQGAEDGSADPPSQLFLTSGVRKVSPGKILVTSNSTKQVYVFDSIGAVIRTQGRNGAGPGEYRNIRLVLASDSATVLLHDAGNMRMTRLLLNDLTESESWSLQAAPAGRIIPQYRFSDGRLLATIPGSPRDPPDKGTVRDSDRVLIVDANFGIAVDVGSHPSVDIVHRKVSETFGFALDGPYSRRLFTAANDSVIVMSSTGEFEIRIYSRDGRLVRLNRISGLQRPVTSSMRDQYRTRLMKTATDDLIKRAWEMRSADDVFPQELPAFDQLLLDRLGYIWIRRTVTEADESAEWLVTTTAGVPVAKVAAPAQFVFHDILEGSIVGVWTDQWEREQVREYRLTREAVKVDQRPN